MLLLKVPERDSLAPSRMSSSSFVGNYFTFNIDIFLFRVAILLNVLLILSFSFYSSCSSFFFGVFNLWSLSKNES